MDMKKFLGTILLLAVVLPAQGSSPELAPGHPEQYVVQKGDTLWDIASRFLRDPWRWPDIWDRNPQIDNPHLIYPGDIVSLVYSGGKPIIRVQRGGGPTRGPAESRPGQPADRPAHRRAGRTEVRYGPQVRVVDRETAIPTIPLDAIAQFLNASQVVSDAELEMAPYVVSLGKEHLMAGSYQKVYARGVKSGDPARFGVYRRGQVYRNPGEFQNGMYTGRGELLGYEALYVGDAVLERHGDPATLYLTKTDREVLSGDRLLPATDEALSANFFPKVYDESRRGHIIAVIDGVTNIGQSQVVVLNLGTRDGIQAGHVLAVYQTGVMVRDDVKYRERRSRRREQAIEEEVSDVGGTDGFPQVQGKKPAWIQGWARERDRPAGYLPKGIRGARGELVELPSERAGIVMVFRPFERVSYALVMEATQAMHLYDSVTQP